MENEMNNETVIIPDEKSGNLSDSLDEEEASELTASERTADDETYISSEDNPLDDGEEYDEDGDFHEKFPETVGVEITDKEKYSALRALGLTHTEAYSFSERKAIRLDGRAHLTSSVPTAAKSPTLGMSKREMKEARELFSNLSDADIFKLYKKVTRQERN